MSFFDSRPAAAGLFVAIALGAGQQPLTAEEAIPKPRAALVSVKRIWDEGRHNGFPDLIRFQDQWFVCLREGERHAGGEDGKIRIIVSSDGEQWESAALLTVDGVDLRDPKLSETPDGRLMLVCGGSIYEDEEVDGRVRPNGKYVTRWTRVAFSGDGRTWTTPRKILGKGDWLWRVTWHEGRAYGLSKLGYGKNPRRGVLYTSDDGLEWEEIVKWGGLVKDVVSETTLRFTEDSEMIAAIRPVFIGTSKPPFREWEFRRAGGALQGPNLLQLPDGSLWVSTRRAKKLTPEQQAQRGTGKGWSQHQALIRVNRDTGAFEEVLYLPSGGDTGYSGLVWHDGFLWMAYYADLGGSSIHFAKVAVDLDR